VDTNIFVSTLLGSAGASREVIRRCLLGRVQPLMGAALFTEYEALFHRDHLYERSPLDKREREILLDAFMSVCAWTSIYYRWRPNLVDEDDNHVVELAVAGGASVIVTKNVRDLGGSELRFPELQICKPEEFLALMK